MVERKRLRTPNRQEMITNRQEIIRREIIRRAVRESGVNIDFLEPVTREEAWEQVIDPLGWRDFLADKGLILTSEINVRNRREEIVGVAFFGPKVPADPSRGNTGAIGMKGGPIMLGDF